MQASDDNVIHLNGDRPLAQLAQRAVLVPLRPRDELEQQALPAKLQELHAKANADQHPVLAPTHIMVKDGQIIGYFSLGGMPVVQAWFDSQHKHAADSLKMIEHGETLFREQGIRTYGLCCAADSPFTPHLERLGFRKRGTTVFWEKDL